MVTLDQAGRDPGEVWKIRPNEGIGVLVHSIAVLRPSAADPSTATWRIVADGAPHLLLHYIADSQTTRHRLVVVGARRVFTDVDKRHRVLTVVVRLRPGALYSLFGVPAPELTDKAIELDALLGSVGTPMISLLADTAQATPLRSMMTFLNRMVLRARPLDTRIQRLVHLVEAGTTEVDTAARAVGMGGRGLRRLAWHQLGLSPKRTMRIERLHRALERGLAAGRPAWGPVAFDAGYSDQAHLIRECNTLLGETPAAFLRRRN